MLRDRQTHREWWVVVGLGVGGVAVAALVTLTPWRADLPPRLEKVVGIEVPVGGTHVLTAAYDTR
jgi:hypothetical protein